MPAAISFPLRPLLSALHPDEVRAAGRTAQLYELRAPFECVLPDGRRLTVPAGYLTDFASIPAAALWYVDDDAPEILYGSIVHDWLYSCQGATGDGQNFTRRAADELLRASMLACGASAMEARVVYAAVRLGGGSHWKD